MKNSLYSKYSISIIFLAFLILIFFIIYMTFNKQDCGNKDKIDEETCKKCAYPKIRYRKFKVVY